MLIDKIGIDAFRELVEEELSGDWVAERDFSVERRSCFDSRRGRPARPGASARYATARNGDQREFDRFLAANVAAAAPAGLRHGRGQRRAAAT